MNTTITKRLEFDAGHRVLGHGGKCRFIHGHRYCAEITVEAQKLNELDMVIDFSDIKKLVGGWIDKNWDHNFLCHEDDPIMKLCRHMETDVWSDSIIDAHLQDAFNRLPFIMPNGNPTAENMAAVLFKEADVLLRDNRINVLGVRLFETPTCYAEVSRSS